MTTTRQFLTKIDDFNARVYAEEARLRALHKEHEIEPELPAIEPVTGEGLDPQPDKAA